MKETSRIVTETNNTHLNKHRWYAYKDTWEKLHVLSVCFPFKEDEESAEH